MKYDNFLTKNVPKTLTRRFVCPQPPGHNPGRVPQVRPREKQLFFPPAMCMIKSSVPSCPIRSWGITGRIARPQTAPRPYKEVSAIPMLRRAAAALLALALLLSLSACQSPQQAAAPLEVTFFDVGKGDAILIACGGATMLIDTGYHDTADVILDYCAQNQIERLDYLVLTHFDKDHVGGADLVLDSLAVGQVLQPNYTSDSKQTLQYQDSMERAGLTPTVVTQVTQLTLGGAHIVVDPPRQSFYEEEDNDFSLVLSLTFGATRMLFAGDSQQARLQELLEDAPFPLEHDLLKVPHHGKKEDNLEQFFQAVSPTYAVITCSPSQMPSAKVVEMLANLGAQVLLTSDGTITFTSDGTQLSPQT